LKPELPPIRRSIRVSWSPHDAFRRFTEEFGRWWPWRTHSIGGTRVRRVVFECREDGLIFEEHADGRRFQWGRVLELDAPRRIKFTWHPSRDASAAQEVELLFHPEGAGTRVELISDKWENWGKGAGRARKGYDVGWGYVLNVWAARRTPSMAVLDGVALVARGVEILRGGTRASIARAGGEIARSSPRAS
jgi:uncharacterized protein YndB with AHSA1/START domain